MAATLTNNEPLNTFTEALQEALKGVEAEFHENPLRSLDLDGIAEYIHRKHPKNVIILSGAGISTSAGIPDFRTPGSGLYSKLDEYEVSSPQDLFNLDFFYENPKPFYKLAKELFPKEIKPTPVHYFVRLLEKKGMLLRWFTQNIDSLEVRAGLTPEKVFAAHGSHATSTCLKCLHKFDLDWINKHLEDETKLIAYCDVNGCGGVVKPDIIFFSESLPKEFFLRIVEDFPYCDLLIVLGTSLVVQPFASLVDEVDSDVPRLLFNREAVGQFKDLENRPPPRIPFEVQFGKEIKECKRDVFHAGDCDSGVIALAEKLGWGEELDELIAHGPPNQEISVELTTLN